LEVTPLRKWHATKNSCVFAQLRKYDKRQRRWRMPEIASADITHREARQRSDLSERVKREKSSAETRGVNHGFNQGVSAKEISP
jgi:hypothetical protein